MVIIVSWSAYAFWHSLPSPLFNTSFSNILLSKDRQLLAAHIAKDEQWRFPEIEHVPEKFRQSIIHYEDKRFLNHIGFDPLAMLRAIRLNLQQGRVVSGGSTLTMQVIRLAKQNPPRTVWQKLKELVQAVRLEIAYDKPDILRLYASYAPFGGNVVGLEAAAWRYFARTPEQLSWAESAMLAVLPNSPALIHPGRNREALLQKRNRLLKRLFDSHVIDQLTYELAITETLPQKPHPLPRLAPHLLETLQVKLPQQARYHSSLDYSLQRQLLKLAKNYAANLRLSDIQNLAVLVIDNKSFEVLAYIGNAPNEQALDQNGLAIDLIQRPRSTGSTLKPLLFAAMLQQGEVLPESLISDVPVHYAGFMPKNFDRAYRGAVPAKYALARSLNIPAVNMLSQFGVARFQHFLQNMGLSHLTRSSDNYGLSLILGGSEASLWELTQLYANLAWIAQQHKGDVFYRKAKWLHGTNQPLIQPSELDSATAWMTLQALLEVTRPGVDGYWRKFSSSRKIAWKTGTSFGQRDAWSIGTTPNYTVGVWVGNANGEGRPNMTGSNTAAPLMFNAFNLLPDNNRWFEKPTHRFKTIQVCVNDGYLSNGNCQTEDYEIPQNVRFTKLSPYHHRIHLDQTEQFQVHGGCESPSNMKHQTAFILPPDQAYYYRQHHADYQTPPPFRADCLTTANTNYNKGFSISYPKNGAQIYIPTEIDGTAGKVVMKVIADNPEQTLHWHLNDQFIGSTQTFHQQAVYLTAGKHQLLVLDNYGNQAGLSFRVLNN